MEKDKEIMWIHIEMDFKTPNHLSKSNRWKLLNLIRYIVIDLKPKRKFWLYEDYPDFFLALEINRFKLLHLSSLQIAFYNSISPKFVKKLWLVAPSTDTGNCEAFLNVMNAYADTILKEQKLPYQHLEHCMLNQFGMDATNEALWHYELAKERIAMVKLLRREHGIGKGDNKKALHKRVQRKAG